MENSDFSRDGDLLLLCMCLSSLYVLVVIEIYHTCHILPTSEIDLGLFWADLTDLEGETPISQNWLKG